MRRVRLLVDDPETLCGDDEPDQPNAVPIFFTGIPTQGEPSDSFVRAVASARFLTLEEAKQRSARAKRCGHVNKPPDIPACATIFADPTNARPAHTRTRVQPDSHELLTHKPGHFGDKRRLMQRPGNFLPVVRSSQ